MIYPLITRHDTKGYCERMASLRKLLIENLRALRKARGLTQEKVAEGAGLSLGGYQQIEYERNWPSDTTLERIAEVLSVPVSALFVDKPSKIVPIRPKPTPEEALRVLAEMVERSAPKG